MGFILGVMIDCADWFMDGGGGIEERMVVDKGENVSVFSVGGGGGVDGQVGLGEELEGF